MMKCEFSVALDQSIHQITWSERGRERAAEEGHIFTKQ